MLSAYARLKRLPAARAGRCAGLVALLVSGALPALAHHPFGGETPSNALTGFLSGLGHPVIGFDHFVFVAAAGLLAARVSRGWMAAAAFVVATLAGTGIHLAAVDLPVAELVISTSVLAAGVLLALASAPPLPLVMVVLTLAGVFHGYAYGEAIVGAEMTPLVAYLAGFALIQLAVAWVAYGIGRWGLRSPQSAFTPSPISLRFAGFTIAGVGLAFLSSLLG